MSDLAAKIQAVLDRVRPALQTDGGDIELVEVTWTSARVRLHGSRAGYPGSIATLRLGIEQLLREEIPDFGEVLPLINEGPEPSPGPRA